jgi:putative FmdB family regulatory protein
MPIYEYRCKQCENRFEKLRPLAEVHHPAVCPKCQSEQTMRVLSLFAATSSENDSACESSIINGTTCGRVSGLG